MSNIQNKTCKCKKFVADMREHLDKLEMYEYEFKLAIKDKDTVDRGIFAIGMLDEAYSITRLITQPNIGLSFS